MTFGTSGVVGAAVVCGFGVTGIVGATGAGGMGCTDLVGAGCGTEMQGLTEACNVTVMVSGAVLAGLTLHSCRCHLMW